MSLLARILGCLAALCMGGASAKTFTVPSDEEVLAKLRPVLRGHDEYLHRKLKKVGKKTVELEAMIVAEGDMKYVPVAFGNWAGYSKWALKDINKKPGGGSYLLHVIDLWVEPGEKDTLRTHFRFDFPLFKKEIKRAFRMSSSSTPKSFTLLGEGIPADDSPIGAANGLMKIFPAENKPGRIWIYGKGSAQFRNWLLYEALPERLFSKETGERMLIVLNNYLKEEDRLRARDARESRKTAGAAEPNAAAGRPPKN